MRRENITGQAFGRLVAVRDTGSIKGRRQWLCVCSCGKEITASVGALKSGNTQSCGCYRKELIQKNAKKHGAKINKSPTKEYVAWILMRDRCNNSNNKSYSYYGGRGIKVTERWDDFENFISDMGAKPDGFTLDRIDSDGNYEPNNCRWASRKEQSRNRKYCKKVTWLGIERFLFELTDEYKIPLQLAHQRLHRGWSLEKTLTQPARNK